MLQSISIACVKNVENVIGQVCAIYRIRWLAGEEETSCIRKPDRICSILQNWIPTGNVKLAVKKFTGFLVNSSILTISLWLITTRIPLIRAFNRVGAVYVYI